MEKTAKQKKPYWTPMRTAVTGIFIALAVVGSLIKFPSPTGTVAMDSLPGFFAVLAFGYGVGIIAIGFGHLATSATVGFPLGTLHLFIAVLMGVAAILFRVIYTKFPIKWRNVNLILSIIVAATFNGLMAFFLVPELGWALAIVITPSLMVAAYVNVVAAGIIFGVLRKARRV